MKDNIFIELVKLNKEKMDIESKIDKLRLELIKLHQQDGEIKIEHNGYRSILRALPLSLVYLQKEYGIDSKSLPSECFEIKESFVLNQEKLEQYLKSKDIELDNKYTVTFSKVKEKIDFEKISKDLT